MPQTSVTTVRARRPDPEPLEVNAVKVVAIGTVLWAIALIGCLAFLPRLRADGHLWWVPTAVVGLLLGLLGIWVCRRREIRLRRPEAGSRPPAADELPPPLS